ncbi:MAG: HAD hydrolase-like protein [bacterium]|nr:HAD hydrolase-like protein [bacterium]
MKAILLRIIYFDLGDTLVRQVAASPSSVRFDWVPGAKNLLERLQQTDLNLGLISNTGNISRAQLHQMLPHDFRFDLFEENLVLLSSEVGWEKPDLRIFRLAVNRAQNHINPDFKMRIDPQECLFVGESLEEVLAAQQIGMVGARVREAPQPDIEGLDDILGKCGLLN